MKTPDLDALHGLFAALADPTRLRIIGLLARGEVCVCDIHDTLKISQPKASRHLAYLRKSGLVLAEKRGLWVHYRLADGIAGAPDAVLAVVRQALRNVDIVRRDAARLERMMCCAPAETDAKRR